MAKVINIPTVYQCYILQKKFVGIDQFYSFIYSSNFAPQDPVEREILRSMTIIEIKGHIMRANLRTILTLKKNLSKK